LKDSDSIKKYGIRDPLAKTQKVIFFVMVVLFFAYFRVDFLFAFDKKLPKGPVNIEAGRITYDSNLDIYRAEDNVVITFEGGYLKADTVTLNKTTKDVWAEGHVEIKSRKDLLEGEKAYFNIETKTGRLVDGKLFFYKNHFYLSGTEIEKKGEATYYLKNATATTCDGPQPDWMFTGKEINVTIDGYGTLKHGTFQVRNCPIIYMPYLIFPAKTTRQAGFLFPRIAYSRDKHGWDLGIPFFWPVSDNTDATFYQRYMDKRGLQEGVEFRYCISRNSFGTFYGDYLNDTKDITETEEDGLSRDWRGNHKRWSYYLNHETIFSPGFYLRTDINKVSDNWYFKDFSSHNYYLKHYKKGGAEKFKRVSFLGDKSLASLGSTARLVKEWNLFNLTALVQYTDNFQSYSNDTTLQKYPEVTFTGVTQPVFNSPVNFELESAYDYYYRAEGYKGHLLDVHPVFSLPLNYGNYFQFTPEIGLRETKWDSTHSDDTTGGKRGSREMYDMGATLSMEVHRIFDIEGQTIEKIRHGIRPELTYTYIPYVYQEDLVDYADVVAEKNSLTYSLTNTFTARLKDENGNKSYREFLRIKLSQAYDIKEARRDPDSSTSEKRPFSPIDMEFEFVPFKYLSFDGDASFDVNDGEWKKLNYNLDISDWRGDSVKAEYSYTQSSSEAVNIYLKAKASKSLNLNYVLRRNKFDGKNLETTYGLEYHKQCWAVEMTYSDTSDDEAYMVVFSLYGLGKVGM
jgi:LPS-assembly protein